MSPKYIYLQYQCVQRFGGNEKRVILRGKAFHNHRLLNDHLWLEAWCRVDGRSPAQAASDWRIHPKIRSPVERAHMLVTEAIGYGRWLGTLGVGLRLLFELQQYAKNVVGVAGAEIARLQFVHGLEKCGEGIMWPPLSGGCLLGTPCSQIFAADWRPGNGQIDIGNWFGCGWIWRICIQEAQLGQAISFSCS